MTFTCQCGRKLKVTVFPLHCSCGRSSNADGSLVAIAPPKKEILTTCLHRGPHIGTASCGCGGIYLCELLGGYCGDREVVEFATIGQDVLTRDNYRRCGGCAEFSGKDKES